MRRRNKIYLKRKDYQKSIGEGRNLLFDFDKRIVVSVVWDQKSEKNNFVGYGRYKITHAWIAETRTEAISFAEYPFIRTKKDQATVKRIIRSNCEHEYDYWNYHAVCHKCHLWIIGDYRNQVIEIEGEEAVKLHDDYILARYGKQGLALRREEVGVND